MKKTLFATWLTLMLCCLSAFAFEAQELPTGGYTQRVEIIEESQLPEDDGFSDKAAPALFSMTDTTQGFTSVPLDEYYGYKTLLAEGEKYSNAYLDLLEGLKKRETTIDLSKHNLTSDDFDMVFNACLNDHPELFYVKNTRYGYATSSSYVIEAVPAYIDDLGSSEDVNDLEAAANKIIKGSGVRPEMSDYEKALLLHDELALHVTYNHEAAAEIQEAEQTQNKAKLEELEATYPNIHSAYGALYDEEAVCDGYARAYQYLLYKVGITSHIATGTANGGGHAWNLVCLDKEWYYTDLTWGDGNGAIFYEYFNMTYEQLVDSNHDLKNPYAMPKCDSTKHNYFTINGGIMTTAGDIENVVEQLRKSAYARVYVTGDKTTVSDIYSWYSANFFTIADKLGLQGSFSIGYKRGQREWHLILSRDVARPLRNVAVEVFSTTDKQCDVLVGFFDENNILIDVTQVNDVTLKENKATLVNCTDAPDEYKTVKYFIWDSSEGLKPLYDDTSVRY